MTGLAFYRLRRALAMLLCVGILCQGATVLAEGDAATAETQPSASQTAEATDTPAPVKKEAAAQTEATATDAAATPENTETADVTANPDASATPMPDETALLDGSATPVASETPATEDTPPVCTIEGCTHIAYDADGKPTALCPLGEWMLAHGDYIHQAKEVAPATALFAAPAPGAVKLIDGTTTLYRSGTYILSGGSAASTVIVSPNLAVALVLHSATIGRLTLGDGVSAEIDFTGISNINHMHAGNGTISIDGTGSVAVGDMDDLATANLSMAGGSINLPAGATSANGRIRFDCDATGATSATLDGAAFPFTTPDGGGQAHLWLPALGSGDSYHSAVQSGVLAVRSTEADPGVGDTFDMDGTAEYVAVANQITSVVSSGGAPVYHRLKVDQSGVSLVFSSVLLGSNVDIALESAARIHVSGTCSAGKVAGSATASVTGSGMLTADEIAVDTLRCAGGVRIRYGTAGGGWQSGWQALSSPIALDTVDSLTYNGKIYAIASKTGETAAFYAPLPAPESGSRYDVRAAGTTLVASLIPLDTQTLVLGSSGLTLSADGNYVIVTDGSASGSIVVAEGVKASILLRSASTNGSLSLGAGAQVTLALEGSNRLEGGISMASGAKLAFKKSGALVCGNISGAGAKQITADSNTNITLTGGSTLGTSSLKPTLIRVTDTGLTPLANKGVTLRISTGKPFATTTAAGGLVTLWGSRVQKNTSVVVLSQASTYAEVLTGTTTNPEALPKITNVESHAAGYVTYQLTDAQSSGIQVYVNREGVTMPDTYLADAMQVQRLYGECNILGLKAGDVVTYRVYAAKQAGQTLSAKTADAFQFSDQHTFTVGTPRKVFALGKKTKEYDRSPFSFGSGVIPSGASVTYYLGAVALSTAPTDVGKYTAVVVIPAGHATYIPTSISVSVTITRKIVLITPEYASKVKGQPDPAFPYTYSGTFEGDTVTGPLGRKKGELHGNYPYHTSWLVAADYYTLRIDPESPMFFIDWGPGHYIKVDPLSIIDPVHQVVEFTDGTKLNLILRTGNRLTISGTAYGEMVIDPDDRRTRPFSPELRLKHGYNQAMILIQAEPEINDDGGYATDADGKLLLNPRTLTLSAYQLSRFKAQRITAVGFRLQGVMCVLDLAQLQADAVTAAMATAGISQMGARYEITLDPVTSVAELGDAPEAAQTDKALGATMMRVRIEVQSGGNTLDIAWLIPSARTVFDVSALLSDAAETSPEIAEITVGRTQSEPEDDTALTTDTMDLVQRILQQKLDTLGVHLNYYDTATQTLDSQLVVPYTASEAEAFDYTAVMQTSPYLMTRHLRNGLYGLAETPAP